MQSPDRADPSNEVASIARAAREVSALCWVFEETVAASLGLNRTDLECLDIILTKRDVSAGRLAEATGLTTGAVTGVIDRLEARGYAGRQSDPCDRRKVLLRPTAATLDIVTRLQGPLTEATERHLSSYGPAELATLLHYLTRSAALARAAIEELRAGVIPDAEPAPASNPVGAEKLRELAA